MGSPDKTPEFFTPLSHGIWDHSSKFLGRPLSFMLYAYMLCYAKGQGSDRGKISFSIKDLAALLSYGRDHGAVHEADLHVSPSSIRRALNHLESIKFIKVLSRGANKKNDCWEISINKYKGAMNSFPSVVQVQEPESPDDPEEQPVFVPLTQPQLDLFEQQNETLFDTGEEKKDREKRKRHDYSGMVVIPEHAVMINLLKLASAGVEDVLSFNREFVLLAESNPSKHYRKVLKKIRSGEYRDKSSEEIVKTDAATRMADYLTELIIGKKNPKPKKVRETAANARFELIRLYWNGMLRNEKPVLEQLTAPKNVKRTSKVNKRFEEEYFAENWAEAIVKAKNSPYCRGEVNGWVANLEWFINNDSSIRRIMEGRYENGQRRQKPKGPARTFDYDAYVGPEAPGSALDEIDLEEDGSAGEAEA